MMLLSTVQCRNWRRRRRPLSLCVLVSCNDPSLRLPMMSLSTPQEEEEDDDGNLSDPPPMEYDANRDREINEDPDQSDGGGSGGGGEEEEVGCVLSSFSLLLVRGFAAVAGG